MFRSPSNAQTAPSPRRAPAPSLALPATRRVFRVAALACILLLACGDSSDAPLETDAEPGTSSASRPSATMTPSPTAISPSASRTSARGTDTTSIGQSDWAPPRLCALIDDAERCEPALTVSAEALAPGETFEREVTLRYSGAEAMLHLRGETTAEVSFDGVGNGPWTLVPGDRTLRVRSREGRVDAGFDFEIELEARGVGEGVPDDTDSLTLRFQAGVVTCAERFPDTGRATCDGEWETGCEVNLDTSSAHCGACANDCSEGLERGLGLCRDGGCETLCAEGYFGEACELARCEESCEAPRVCGEEGAVQDCYCPPGTSGEACEFSVCDALDCGNGACVLDTQGTPRCVCDAGFTGPACDEDGVIRATAGGQAYDDPDDLFRFPREGVEGCTPDYGATLACPDGWVLTGRRFVRDPEGDQIAAMGVICGRIEDASDPVGGDGEGDDAPLTRVDPAAHWEGPLVGWTLDNTPVEARCPADHILVSIGHSSEAPDDFDPGASDIEPWDYTQGVDLVEAADWCLPSDLLADTSARALGSNRLPRISVVQRPAPESPLASVNTRRTVLLQAKLTQRPGHRALEIGFDADARRWCTLAVDAREGSCGSGFSGPRCEPDAAE